MFYALNVSSLHKFTSHGGEIFTKQRSVVAHALGVMAEYEHTVPAHQIGFPLERDGGVDRVGLDHTNNVVRLLSNGKLPYQPHENMCAINNMEGA